ncbi:MAG: flagellar hook-basal body complex protein FliE [Myxococcales bacterium]|nr:flagellar hook-basal body complex protein FliE [Myxococcales bacterium]
METFRIGDSAPAKIEMQTPALEIEKEKTPGDVFGEMVRSILDQANEAQLNADKKAEMFAKDEVGIVETVLAVNKADISLRMLLEVRNRALEAYRELTRAV